MATHFSANQYENAFVAKRLQNWQIPHKFKEHPDMRIGGTKAISNDRGHLLEGIQRSSESPWGNFKGTWDPSRTCPCTKHSHALTSSNVPKASCFRKDCEGDERTKEVQHIRSCGGHTNLLKDSPRSNEKQSPSRQSLSPEVVKATSSGKKSPTPDDIKVRSPVRDNVDKQLDTEG